LINEAKEIEKNKSIALVNIPLLGGAAWGDVLL